MERDNTARVRIARVGNLLVKNRYTVARSYLK
jgi:hypothetical protein